MTRSELSPARFRHQDDRRPICRALLAERSGHAGGHGIACRGVRGLATSLPEKLERRSDGVQAGRRVRSSIKLTLTPGLAAAEGHFTLCKG